MQAFVETNRATIPGFGYLFSQAALARTHSVRDAPVAAQVDGFPVLAYSHGYGLFVSQNTPLMEELASHGYIVFGLGHTWDGSTVFPDGRTVGLGRHILALQDRAADPDYVREMTESVTMLSHGSSEAERRQALATQRAAARRDRDEGLGTGLSAEVWLEDRRRFFDVLDDLQTGARPSRFAVASTFRGSGCLACRSAAPRPWRPAIGSLVAARPSTSTEDTGSCSIPTCSTGTCACPC